MTRCIVVVGRKRETNERSEKVQTKEKQKSHLFVSVAKDTFFLLEPKTLAKTDA